MHNDILIQGGLGNNTDATKVRPETPSHRRSPGLSTTNESRDKDYERLGRCTMAMAEGVVSRVSDS